MMRCASSTATILATTGVQAARFQEGGQKGRLAYPLGLVDLLVNPAELTGGQVFDVTGANVEVYQPFELVSGGDVVASQLWVVNGDTSGR